MHAYVQKCMYTYIIYVKYECMYTSIYPPSFSHSLRESRRERERERQRACACVDIHVHNQHTHTHSLSRTSTHSLTYTHTQYTPENMKVYVFRPDFYHSPDWLLRALSIHIWTHSICPLHPLQSRQRLSLHHQQLSCELGAECNF